MKPEFLLSIRIIRFHKKKKIKHAIFGQLNKNLTNYLIVITKIKESHLSYSRITETQLYNKMHRYLIKIFTLIIVHQLINIFKLKRKF